ncbi:UNVERIFIED_CONTAM: hypothetical protein FKN15_049059 [Acipenser sinensis]
MGRLGGYRDHPEGDAVPLKEMPGVQSPEPQCSPLEDGGPPSSAETPGQGGSTELWAEVQRLLDALDSSINSRRARAVSCTFQDSDSHIEHLTAAWETWVHVTQVRRIKDSAECLIASITMIPGVNRELKRDFHMLVLSSALPAPSICAHRSHYVLEIDLEPNK